MDMAAQRSLRYHSTTGFAGATARRRASFRRIWARSEPSVVRFKLLRFYDGPNRRAGALVGQAAS